MPRRPRDEEEAIIAEEEPIELSDEDRLPWLEAVEEDEDEGGPSLAKLAAAIVIGWSRSDRRRRSLLARQSRRPAGNDSDLIAAEEGDYKVRPADPGGMNVAGEGDAAHQASAATSRAASQCRCGQRSAASSGQPGAGQQPPRRSRSARAPDARSASPPGARAAPGRVRTDDPARRLLQPGRRQPRLGRPFGPIPLSGAAEPQCRRRQCRRPHRLSPARQRPDRRRRLPPPADRGRGLLGRLLRAFRPAHPAPLRRRLGRRSKT